MATACIIPPLSTSKNGIHVCARCFCPATTRCSRCKSVRYCSGKCQIIHWRQVHKEECQRLETTSSCSSPMATSCDESIPEKLSINDGLDLFSLGYNSKQPAMDTGLSDNNVHPLTSAGACAAGKYGINAHEIGTNVVFNVVDFSSAGASVDGEMAGKKCSYEKPVTNGNVKANTALHPMGNKSLKSSKSKMKFSGDQSYFKIDGKGQLTDDSKVARMHNANPAAETNGVTSQLRMLFPYEEFVNIFNCEVIDLTPRGLVNCGNSCYANAVLQCLTCTKPLIVFLLRRSHSRACREIDWCLMCELEQHVMMLRESGGPLSPSRILLHMRKINHQIGNGSQEDAHEFLRLLIASMQSIYLEKLGGEDKVDPRLQETTFIQHTFGGRLRSKHYLIAAGNIFAFGLFVSPIPTFRRIIRNRSTEQFSGLPYIYALMNCLICMWYGTPLVSADNLLLVTVNSFGAVFQLAYIILFIIYAERRIKVFIPSSLQALSAFSGFSMVIPYIFFPLLLAVGSLTVVSLISMFASPLFIINLVIRTKSVEFMPFYLSLSTFLMSSSFVLYGLLNFDAFVYVPNGIGTILGIIQLALYVHYKKKSTQDSIEPLIASHA
ncbi:hypothetical protein NC652_028682 [Populus alba x Populus x berolinensis]|nr:hypothetical protein NC652_028682 [Populus alba x Populus x berolinensis]